MGNVINGSTFKLEFNAGVCIIASVQFNFTMRDFTRLNSNK